MAIIKPSTYIMGIIVFTFFIVSGMTMIMEMKTVKPGFAEEDSFTSFNNTFNKYQDLTTAVNKSGSFLEQQPQFGVFGGLNALVESAWNTLKLLGTSFSFMNDVFNGLHTVFGIPAFVGGLLILAVVILIVFAILSAIFRLDI